MRIWLMTATPSDQIPETLLIRGVNDRGERIASHLSIVLSAELRQLIARLSRDADLPLWQQEIVIALRYTAEESRPLYRRTGNGLQPVLDAGGTPVCENVLNVSAIWPIFDLDVHRACAHSAVNCEELEARG
ncbi:hypothetical protein [Parvibaculum sp. MBR-TMA-1.3b-4.2]